LRPALPDQNRDSLDRGGYRLFRLIGGVEDSLVEVGLFRNRGYFFGHKVVVPGRSTSIYGEPEKARRSVTVFG
jgi:hypothetical protein